MVTELFMQKYDTPCDYENVPLFIKGFVTMLHALTPDIWRLASVLS